MPSRAGRPRASLPGRVASGHSGYPAAVRGRLLGIALVALGCALLLAPAEAPGSISRSRLRHGLTNQMQRAGGASGAWVMDMDAPRNRTLFSWASRTRRVLASNTKLFTTGAVLDRFGANERLTTRLYARRRRALHGHTLKGSLVIVGAGDPALASVGFARHNNLPLTRIANLASDIRKAGIRRITGAIRADDSIFDRRRGVPTSGVDASGELAPLSGLSYNSGFAGGHYAANPELVAARTLKHRLRELGVRVKRGIGRANLPTSALRRKPLGKVRSPRMANLIAETNKPSNNFFAEMLLKRLAARRGVQGTTRRGARKAERFARKLGGRVRMENGSGLSRSNRASPRQVGRFLVAMNRQAGPAPLPPLAAAGRAPGDRRPTHERDRRRGPLPSQDRHPDRRQHPLGLLPGGPRTGRLLDPDELG